MVRRATQLFAMTAMEHGTGPQTNHDYDPLGQLHVTTHLLGLFQRTTALPMMMTGPLDSCD